jgi:hypothetical protein
MLKRFPLAHQIAHFPHQGLMTVDDRLCRLVVLVEARRGHRLLEVFDRLLAVGNPALQFVDPLAAGVGRFSFTPSLGFLPF